MKCTSSPTAAPSAATPDRPPQRFDDREAAGSSPPAETARSDRWWATLAAAVIHKPTAAGLAIRPTRLTPASSYSASIAVTAPWVGCGTPAARAGSPGPVRGGRFPARRGPHSTKLPVTQAVTWTIRQSPWRHPTMRIGLTVVYVDDQDQAEWFYSDVLGMRIKTNAPYGSGRWLTVVSLEDPDGVELVLYLADDAARDFQQASRELGRPAFSLRTDDCLRDSTQLKAKGVVFVTEPAWRDYGGMDAVFDDT